MGKQDTGGPAFPEKFHTRDERGGVTGDYIHTPGMTLLDWFAGQAMAGLAAGESKELGFYADDQDRVTAAYDVAAAMIAEKRRREAGNES